jgi:hypothetical protein
MRRQYSRSCARIKWRVAARWLGEATQEGFGSATPGHCTKGLGVLPHGPPVTREVRSGTERGSVGPKTKSWFAPTARNTTYCYTCGGCSPTGAGKALLRPKGLLNIKEASGNDMAENVSMHAARQWYWRRSRAAIGVDK